MTVAVLFKKEQPIRMTTTCPAIGAMTERRKAKRIQMQSANHSISDAAWPASIRQTQHSIPIERQNAVLHQIHQCAPALYRLFVCLSSVVVCRDSVHLCDSCFDMDWFDVFDVRVGINLLLINLIYLRDIFNNFCSATINFSPTNIFVLTSWSL